MPQKPPETLAAVDLGSNSFHMIVCSLREGNLQVIDRLKEMVRLSSGLDDRNILSPASIQRALACLERFAQRIRHFPPGSVRIVGTSALRRAKNAHEFLLEAEAVLNHPIDIISGIEEARLIYLGVAYSIGSSGHPRLVMDIGGGSTEYIIGAGALPIEKESLHMGCVVVSDLFFPDGKVTRSALSQAILYAEQKLEPFQKKFHRKNWTEAIGASGSLRAIAKVLQAKNWSQNGITASGLEQLTAHLGQTGHVSQLALPDLDAERLPVFPGGVAIVAATFRMLKIDAMTVADGALREGLIQDLLGRIYDRDIRSDTVAALAERYHTDLAHSSRIKDAVRLLAAQLRHLEPFASESAMQFLFWAADLHEIGIDIAHSQYHKHSAYVIANGDLAGFSGRDQMILAALVKNHRRKFCRADFIKLPSPWPRHAACLAIVLRLAVLMRRNRDDSELPRISITWLKSSIRLQFPEQWLAQAPLTLADLTKEAAFLRPVGFKLNFC